MNNDAPITPLTGMALGSILVVLGISAYVVTGFVSITALIPAVFGIFIATVGYLGQETDRVRLAIGGIAIFALLAILGSLRAVPDIFDLVTGGQVDSVTATVAQGVMIVVGILLLISVLFDTIGNE